MIICFYQEQVELFRQGIFQSFEVDMNYKHLNQEDEYEIIWGFYSRLSQRCKDFKFSSKLILNQLLTILALPLVRVLTNSNNPTTYAYMFNIVFNIFKDKFNFEVKWRHLHGEGLIGITIDQDYSTLIGKVVPNQFQMDLELIRNQLQGLDPIFRKLIKATGLGNIKQSDQFDFV
jgi:hypothetical protein